MSFLGCTTSFATNGDGSSTFTINMDDVTTKCMQSLTPDPEFWICNAVRNRARIEGDTVGVTVKMASVHYNSRGVSYFGGYKVC